MGVFPGKIVRPTQCGRLIYTKLIMLQDAFRGCHIAVNRWNLLNDHNHLRIRLLKVGNKWEAI